MADISIAGELYKSFTSAADVQRLVDLQRSEDLYLEYKSKADPRVVALGDIDRGNLAKTLSAFANADGGVLIWGVGTPQGSKRGVDIAERLVPIDDVSEFCRRLKECALTVVAPPVYGVDFAPILIEGTDSGYVKCIIPKSFQPPHMSLQGAKDGGAKRYWIRSSNGCRIMEHYEIADAFGKRMCPRMTLDVKTNQMNEVGDEMNVRVFLRNEGRGVARHVSFQLEVVGAKLTYVQAPFSNDSALNPGRELIGFERLVGVFHPGRHWMLIGSFGIKKYSPEAQLTFNANIFAEDMEMISASVNVPNNG